MAPHHYSTDYVEKVLKTADGVIEGMFKTLPSMPSQPSPYTRKSGNDDQKLKRAIPVSTMPTLNRPIGGV